MQRPVFERMNRSVPARQSYRAPGRVNLIGEHTDYNDGFVMPAAIDLQTEVIIRARGDREVVISSDLFPDAVEFNLDETTPTARHHWSDYIRGVAVTLERAGYHLQGAELEICSDVPIGSGLSSSAALEVAAAYALLDSIGVAIDPIELARLCQRAENDFVGMRCGIMDQIISCLGKAGNALMLDCRSLEYRHLPLPEDVRLVICNTMVKHELAASKYNQRRVECEAGITHFAKSMPKVRALRDVTIADLELSRTELDETILKRCRHVISENERVIKAAAALEEKNLIAFGDLMAESHRSLREDYEVSCAELDAMVDLANQVEGVYGARMTGGGFGGCTVNIVAADSVQSFKQSLAKGYQKATGIAPDIFVCSTSNGVS